MTNGVICKLGCEKLSTLLFEFIYSGHSSGLRNTFKESSPYFHEHTVLLFSFFYLFCCTFVKKNWQSERIRAVNLIVVGDRMQIILYALRETVQSEKIQVNFFIIICIRGLKIRNDPNPRLQAVKTLWFDLAALRICFKNVLEYLNRSKFARTPY